MVTPLSEGWRIQRDTHGYVAVRTASELRTDLANAKRYRDRWARAEARGGSGPCILE